MIPKIKCKQAVDLISKREEGKISLKQRFQLWQHFIECSLCNTFAKQNKFITKAYPGFYNENKEKLTPQEKEIIVKAVFESGK